MWGNLKKPQPLKPKQNNNDSRKHPASGYDEKNPDAQFPTRSSIPAKKLPHKK